MGAKIFQINASDGGVPKTALFQAQVLAGGLSEDRQGNLKVHGGPDRALCLYSLERLLALQAEGHPIFPGAVGENLTLSGLDWDQVIPGVRLQLGETVRVEVTKYTTPCSNIIPYFIDGDINRINQKKYPGWSRVYARVLQPGNIRTVDTVRVLEG